MPLAQCHLERSKRDNDNIIMEKMQKKLVSVMHRVLNRNLLLEFSFPIFSLSSKYEKTTTAGNISAFSRDVIHSMPSHLPTQRLRQIVFCNSLAPDIWRKSLMVVAPQHNGAICHDI